MHQQSEILIRQKEVCSQHGLGKPGGTLAVLAVILVAQPAGIVREGEQFHHMPVVGDGLGDFLPLFDAVQSFYRTAWRLAFLL